jgi:hypothetical protein
MGQFDDGCMLWCFTKLPPHAPMGDNQYQAEPFAQNGRGLYCECEDQNLVPIGASCSAPFPSNISTADSLSVQCSKDLWQLVYGRDQPASKAHLIELLVDDLMWHQWDNFNSCFGFDTSTGKYFNKSAPCYEVLQTDTGSCSCSKIPSNWSEACAQLQAYPCPSASPPHQDTSSLMHNYGWGFYPQTCSTSDIHNLWVLRVCASGGVSCFPTVTPECTHSLGAPFTSSIQ